MVKPIEKDSSPLCVGVYIADLDMNEKLEKKIRNAEK